MEISLKELIKAVGQNLFQNKWLFLAQGSFLQLLMMFVGTALVQVGFRLILFASNQANLSLDTIYAIFTDPLGWISVLIFILIVAFVLFLEYAVLTFMVVESYQKVSVSWKSLVKITVLKIRTLSWRQIPLFVLYFIFMVPTANLDMGSFLTDRLYIPHFITGELMKTMPGFIGMMVLFFALAYINLRLLFTLPLAIVSDDGFFTALKKSWKITRKGKKKLLLSWFVMETILLMIMVAFTLLFILVGVWIDSKGNNLIVETILLTLCKTLFFYQTFLIKMIFLSSIVYILQKENEIQVELSTKEQGRKYHSGIVGILTIFVLCFGVLNSVTLTKVGLNPEQEIIAHRGYNAVENSLEGLENAAKLKVDYVEFDVQMTKDEKFVVMHDYNLKRLAKINRRIKDMDLKEVEGLPIEQDGKNAVIPSLEQFVQKAKQLDIKLLVELKPDGQDAQQFADHFLKIWDTWEDKEQYKVMSLNRKLMDILERERPSMCTGYVIPIQFGDFDAFDLDFYVIEDFSYRDILTQEAHQAGAKLYVWTINEESQMERYAQSRADGIITDAPGILEQIKQDIAMHNSYLDRMVRLLTEEE